MKTSFMYKCTKGANMAVLQGVYMDSNNKVAVASNGHCMVLSKAAYDSAHAGDVVLKDGSLVDGQYVNYQYAIKMFHTTGFVAKQIICSDATKNAFEVAKGLMKMKEFRHNTIAIRWNGDGFYWWVNFKYHALMKEYGLDGWQSEGACSTAKIETEDGMMAVCPMLVTKEDAVQGLYDAGLWVSKKDHNETGIQQAIEIARTNGLIK